MVTPAMPIAAANPAASSRLLLIMLSSPSRDYRVVFPTMRMHAPAVVDAWEGNTIPPQRGRTIHRRCPTGPRREKCPGHGVRSASSAMRCAGSWSSPSSGWACSAPSAVVEHADRSSGRRPGGRRVGRVVDDGRRGGVSNGTSAQVAAAHDPADRRRRPSPRRPARPPRTTRPRCSSSVTAMPGRSLRTWRRLLDETGLVDVELDYVVSSGLARPDFHDWPAHLRDTLDDERPGHRDRHVRRQRRPGPHRALPQRRRNVRRRRRRCRRPPSPTPRSGPPSTPAGSAS